MQVHFFREPNIHSFISKYEYSPDIFSFSFLGYSGYFVMGYDKIFKIQSQDIVKVEKFSSSLTDIGDNIIYFILTANDGTKFTFGYTEGSIEISGGENAIPFQSHAWYLTKIEFTNGRSINFNYKPNKNIRIHFRTSNDQTVFSTASPVVLDNITSTEEKLYSNPLQRSI